MGWPIENQLGLEEYRYGVQRNDQLEEALDNKGKIQQLERAEKY